MRRLSIRDVSMPSPTNITVDYPEPAARVTERDQYELPSDYEIRLRKEKELRPLEKPLSKNYSRFWYEQKNRGESNFQDIGESIDGSPSSQMQSMQ